MRRSKGPYVRDRTTGDSGTLAFVARFLEAYNHIMAEASGGPPPPSPPLYETRSKDSTKRYIGRASRIGAGTNPFESMWITAIDVKAAALKLDQRSRTVLGRRYILDESHTEIGHALGLSSSYVEKLHANALKRIADILDGVDK